MKHLANWKNNSLAAVYGASVAQSSEQRFDHIHMQICAMEMLIVIVVYLAVTLQYTLSCCYYIQKILSSQYTNVKLFSGRIEIFTEKNNKHFPSVYLTWVESTTAMAQTSRVRSQSTESSRRNKRIFMRLYFEQAGL